MSDNPLLIFLIIYCIVMFHLIYRQTLCWLLLVLSQYLIFLEIFPEVQSPISLSFTTNLPVIIFNKLKKNKIPNFFILSLNYKYCKVHVV